MRSFTLLGAALGVAIALAPKGARACGGCFAPATEVTVVTDHRMALAISEEQTVLWDQIEYQGDPREFAWVLPVRGGARLELSRDDFFVALDQATRTTVYAPSSSSAVCSLGGCASASNASASSGGGGSESVDVLSQSVVGPYETVTLRASEPNALVGWLTAHGYAVSSSIAPVIAAYERAGFDFLALRLKPGCNVRAMRPVRVVSPGADPTLPLRMVAAGAGARVGLTLFVIGEGRWHPRNFPEASIDWSRLTWDFSASRSNYKELAAEALSQDEGRAWLTEYAGVGAPLASLYYRACRAPTSPSAKAAAPPCDRDDAGSVTDADASTNRDASPLGDGCAAFDDLEVALRGLHTADVWITRARAELPARLRGQRRVQRRDRTEPGRRELDRARRDHFGPGDGAPAPSRQWPG